MECVVDIQWSVFCLLLAKCILSSPVPISIPNVAIRRQSQYELTKSDTLQQNPQPTTADVDVDLLRRIQCLRHEYAVLLSHDGIPEGAGGDGTLVRDDGWYSEIRSFVNRNGHTRYYLCRPCTECGKGVRILEHCRIRQDTLCSNLCINTTEVYDDYSRRCYPQDVHSTAMMTTSDPSKLTSYNYKIEATIKFVKDEDDNYGIYDEEDNSKEEEGEMEEKNIWTKEIIPITVGVLTLNIMFVILLVWKKRDRLRKKMAERRTRLQHIQNNTSQLSSPSTVVSNEHNERNPDDPIVIDVTTATISNLPKENNNLAVSYQPDINLLSDTNSSVQPLITAIPEITVKPGTNLYWIEMSAYISPRGGQLSCDQSDVVVEIPPGAVPSLQLITVRVSRTPFIFPVELADGGMFLSPLVDCQSPGLKRFNKDVLIKLPHRAHLGQDWKFTVHYTDNASGELSDTWNAVSSSCLAASKDVSNDASKSHLQTSTPNAASRSEVQFTIDSKHLYITTPHFSKYTCSGCGKKRELSLEAVVYIVDNLDHNRVDLHCYLLDSIKDFHYKLNLNKRDRPHTEHKPLIVSAKKGKHLEVSLMSMRKDWPWVADQSIHGTLQIVHLEDITRCHSDATPVFVTFTLRPLQPQRGQDTTTVWPNTFLEAAVHIKQKSKEHGIKVDVVLDLNFGKHPQNKKGGSVQDIFIPLSKKIRANEWRSLYRTLMKTRTCMINIEASISCLEYRDPNDLTEQIYQGFMKWMSFMGKEATVTRLCESLREGNLVALAEEFEPKKCSTDKPYETNV